MNTVLKQNEFFVKEHVGMFKSSNNYDIYSPESKKMIMNCREDNLNIFTRLLRFTDYKRMTPFNVGIKTPSGERILTVKRGISILISNVEVFDENEKLVGKFKQKFFSIGGKFDIVDPNDNLICTLKGEWTRWDFKFVKDNIEFAHVSKKWAGVGKEMFTTADNYILKINEKVSVEDPIRLLILGAVMCIDMVLKE
jgi:uncharacterized protein YxjI